MIIRPLSARIAQSGKPAWILQLQDFLCKWEWVEQQPAAEVQGMTWLELLIAFELDTQTVRSGGSTFGEAGHCGQGEDLASCHQAIATRPLYQQQLVLGGGGPPKI